MKKHFRLYLQDPPAAFPDIDAEQIVFGHKLHQWRERMGISINAEPKKDETAEKIKNKQTSYQQFVDVFARWKTETHRNFHDWYVEETIGYAKGMLESIKKHLERQRNLPEKFLQTGQVDINDVLPPPAWELVEDLLRITRETGLSMEDGGRKVLEYLQLPNLEKIPAIRIGSLLYAAIADQAARGRRDPPSPGVMVDVDMISGFLPYSDAMFVDKENASFLEDGRVQGKLGYPTKIYSLRNKQDFLKHLDELWENADPAHMEMVRNVYGDTWTDPYLTILEHEGEEKTE